MPPFTLVCYTWLQVRMEARWRVEAARDMIEPHVIGERFTLERLIGQGGIGEVYYGIDQHTNEPVAVKALKPHVVDDNPKLVERFRREGEALKELNHPNIVKILAVIQ